MEESQETKQPKHQNTFFKLKTKRTFQKIVTNGAASISGDKVLQFKYTRFLYPLPSSKGPGP
jgi:hypothetical protein